MKNKNIDQFIYINDKKNVNEVSLILMELMEFKIAVCNKLVDFSV